MPYGIKSAPEVFQKYLHNVVGGLESVASYLDDILTWGSDMEEHDCNLEAVLDRSQMHNLKLRKQKMQLAKTEITYLGHTITANGVQINTKKVEAVLKLQEPKDKKELQRYLGMITYLARFLPNLSDKTEHLRNLVRKDTTFQWDTTARESFESLKNLVVTAPVLAFYDPREPAVVSVDASQYGLGAVLLQAGHPIAYASVTLSKSQRNYAQIEKELLAVVFGCELFHQYTYGKKFLLQTDHKPLVSIVKKDLVCLSPRIQRMMLRLLRYNFHLEHVPGSQLFVADTLSRDPISDASIETDYLEGHAYSVHTVISATEERSRQLQEATTKDQTLCQLRNYIRNGWPDHISATPIEVRPFWPFQSEI